MITKQKRSSFTVYAILTTLTLLSWAAFGAYERFSKIDLTSIPAQILLPTNPNLDTSTLDLLEKKKYLNEQEISSFTPIAGSTQASSSAEVNLDEATESAQ